MSEQDTGQDTGASGEKDASSEAPESTDTTTAKPPEETPPEAEAPSPPAHPPGAAWGDPLQRFEKAWARFETRLAVGVLLAEIASLCAWVFLKGMSTPPTSGKAGVVFRAVMTSLVLGFATWRLLRGKPERLRSTATTIAAAAGLFLGRLWVGVGVTYSSEILNWYQDASTLTLIGGLRGVGTRLTAWLAMLGASLATSSGKHINIDVVMRFLPPKVRVPAAAAAWLAAAAVCFASTWGFVDHIVIASFQAPKESTTGQKVGVLTHELREQFFVLRKQISLDLKVGPRVFTGTKYSEALSGAEWNAHVQEGGYEAWFPKEQVEALLVKGDAVARPVSPLVIVPGKNQRGLLVETLNLLFPFGFFMMGLKFLLRVLLVFSGHVVVDPDAAHREDHDDEPEGEPAAEGGS
jgi:hypothetical protein